jgi:predicted ribosomally synthesized peptide with SipW-like signal peptide
MTNDNINLSRRKILAGVGAAGTAGALGALGTSAYFSDEEKFAGNTLTAGTLDLKVDWEEHYSYPQDYDFDDPTVDDNGDPLDVNRSEPDDAAGYVGLPDPDNPQVWVHEDDLPTYMDNTAIESFPDTNDDGVQDAFDNGDVGSVCEDGADTDADLDPTGDDALRTDNADTITDGEGWEPLVSLSDIKPGDFGELTLSYHLCDNPGYVWLQGGLVEAAENGHTEPEAASDDENGAEDEDVTDLGQGDDVELLDEIRTTLWYDGDCNNVLSAGGGSDEGEIADVVMVLDRSGSMDGQKITEAKNGAKTLVDALGPNDQVSLVSFSSGMNGVTLDQGLTTNHNAVKTAINGISAGGATNMEGGIEQGHEELFSGDQFPNNYGESGNARSSARKIMVVLGDGAPNRDSGVTDSGDGPGSEAFNAKADGAELFAIAYGGAAATMHSIASDPTNNPEDQYYFGSDVTDIQQTFQEIGGNVSSGDEEVIFRGTLRETLEHLESDDGIPLDGDLESDGVTCHPGQQTSCVGLSWYLPYDVGNHVQSDSVAFDVGFYTEQCRNNAAPDPFQPADD